VRKTEMRGYVVAASLLLAGQAGAQKPTATFGASIDAPAMAERVRQEYSHAWDGYTKYAFGHDALKPISKQPHDWYGVSLHMSEIDGLDTMLLMGLTDQAKMAEDDIDKNLNFDQDIYVRNFEITIRCLGGLESAYEITGDKRLLELAVDLGNRLLPAFKSPTGMPYEFVNLRTGQVRSAESNPAEISLLPEFGTLTKLTGKPVYYDTAKRAMVELYKRQSKIGLVGLAINVETGQWTNPIASIGGGIDSYDEYLLKCWLLFGDQDCKRMWESTINAVNKYLADDEKSGFWYGQADIYTALLALGGDLKRAEALQRSSFQMWTLYGIEPEVLATDTLTVTNPSYPLRPEIIESTYYLWHLTGDPLYRNMGHAYYDGLVKWARTPVAYTALLDVRTMKQDDDMESFFFAETLKYLYLLYAPPNTVDWSTHVFNTEAHPLKRFVAGS
jgi:mannosidase alpha-like ER degradation enhancer 2